MGLRDLLRKADGRTGSPAAADAGGRPGGADVTFVRSDSLSHEVMEPPGADAAPPRRSLDVLLPRSASVASASSSQAGRRRRLSQRLHLGRAPESSDKVPDNLPAIVVAGDARDGDGAESQWERRATMLAGHNERVRSPSPSPSASPSPRPVSSLQMDRDIQQAIRLHEAGQLDKSTVLFARLADPGGANNPLSQVLYGLALRHGWGCAPNPEEAVRYLSAAASNAAAVEQAALQAGLKRGGAAKGELVLAIFELANCFRHGWGLPKDAVAAKQYYETAANLGDTDAMNEVAWCYLHAFGCKKDKFAAARYYRRAEKAGSKTLGNSWIWKDKYNAPAL